MEILELLQRVSETMHVNRSFGPAYQQGDVTVVPVAMVAGGGGGGFGPSPTAGSTGGRGEQPELSTTGGGGGGGGVSWPLGVYVIKDGEVRWVPAVDVTRLAVAAIGGVKLLLKLRASSPRRRHRARGE